MSDEKPAPERAVIAAAIEWYEWEAAHAPDGGPHDPRDLRLYQLLSDPSFRQHLAAHTETKLTPEQAIPESREVQDEQFWRDGGGFRWCWPHFDVVRPADRRCRFLLNRYPHNIIGAMVVVFGRGWGIRWKDTR